jgi:S-adenosylmethionine synthetase
MVSKGFFTSESVSEGHPDKIADQISDGVLDALLKQDPESRVACETMVTTGLVCVAGEISTKGYADIPEVVRNTVKEIGYDSSEKGFDYKTCAVMNTIDRQSPDIAMGVDANSEEETGAGDQGIMFGFAINESDTYMPHALSLSHELLRVLAQKRKSGEADFIWPDSKSQITVRYEDGQVKEIDTVVLSTQHSPDVSQKQVQEFIRDGLVKEVLPQNLITNNTKFHINPTGRFVIGGPQGDCGLTGRKIIVDTYGGYGAHGGGAFSGKDATKVDRSAAYAARNIAKNLVATGALDKCLVQLSYAIGVAKPTSVSVQDYGTSKVDKEKLEEAVLKFWDLRPGKIISDFKLKSPNFQKTAAYGHFGRKDVEFEWESLGRVEALKDFLAL